MNDDKKLKLNIVAPDGKISGIECYSVHLPLTDGSYGIRYGHAKAMFAVKSGEVVVLSNGKTVYSVGDGFATVNRNTVTVLTDEINETAEM